MKNQILKILEVYKLTSAQFADIIGVQRSSISHILSGRNKPSYDFILKILENYPQISANWLITTRGEMFNSAIESSSNDKDLNLFSSLNQTRPNKHEIHTKSDFTDNKRNEHDENIIQNKSFHNSNINHEITNVNKVKNIILVYEDNTFEIINKK